MRAPTHSLGVLAGIVIALLLGTAVWAAYPVGGAIGTHYRILGGESGRLGEPTGPERCGLRDAGCVQSFEGGSIHWTRATGAHATWGAIRTAWRTTGWENVKLGYPMSGEYPSGSGVAQDFQGGRIRWTAGGGAVVEIDGPPADFTLTGSGWGHGVGMSQYGARGMAAAGNTSTQILEHYYRPVRVESRTGSANADIRVQLLHGRQSVRIAPQNGMLRVRVSGTVDDNWHPITLTRTADGRVRADVGTASFTGTRIDVEWQNTRAWPSGANPTSVAIDGARAGGTGEYRHGRIEVTSLGSSLNVVNVLRVNTEYLPGVAEMPTGWARPALEAQAIAARTYAYRHLASLSSACGCHVYDEVRSQVFAGWAHENGPGGANWAGAVDGTQSRSDDTVSSARVITHDGRFIDALYSSSSGGTTNRAADVWGNDVPYLQERDDSAAHTSAAGNPYSSWSATITQDAMRRAFGLPDVVDISLTRTGSGMVDTVTATSADGRTAALSGVEARTVLGLRSATFEIAD